MNAISYQDYSQELENIHKLFDKKACVTGISVFIQFVNIGNDENINLGVKVADTGSITPAFAKRFAHCIEIAADIAENFKYNGYSIKQGDEI